MTLYLRISSVISHNFFTNYLEQIWWYGNRRIKQNRFIKKATNVNARVPRHISVSRLSQVNDIIRCSSGRVQTRFLFSRTVIRQEKKQTGRRRQERRRWSNPRERKSLINPTVDRRYVPPQGGDRSVFISWLTRRAARTFRERSATGSNLSSSPRILAGSRGRE